jgi:hypothetical protein
MNISVRTRALALAVSAGLLVAVPLGVPASAALKPSTVCSKLSSSVAINLTAKTGTVSSTFLSCGTGVLKAGGSSKVTTPVAKLTGSLTTKITWKGGKGTTTATEKFASQKTLGKCPKGTKYRTLVTGTTKASTGAAAAVVKVGEPISGEICTTVVSPTKYVSTLLKGTAFKL